MPNEELKSSPFLVQFLFDEGEAVDDGSMNGDQVGIIGLVAGVAESTGGKGMDDACLEAGGGEGVADGLVITSGSFDGDEEVAEVVLTDGLTQALDGVIEGGAVVFDEAWWDKEIAEEVGEHPFGSCLGTIDADDAEVLGADFLDAGMEGAA
jgi:hypothetical protein